MIRCMANCLVSPNIGIPFVAVVVLVSVSGCSSGSYSAARSARSDTTHGVQNRYSQSPYYDDHGGKSIDRVSGFKRYAGMVAVYNRTDEPIGVELLGSISPGGVAKDKFFARVHDARVGARDR